MGRYERNRDRDWVSFFHHYKSQKNDLKNENRRKGRKGERSAEKHGEKNKDKERGEGENRGAKRVKESRITQMKEERWRTKTGC